MATLNKVFLIGRVGKDPEVRQFDGGNKVANFTLATDESYTDRNGQRQTATEWHNLVLNGKLADIAAQYVHKGSMLYIEGKIRTRSWQDQQGNKHYQTEVVGLGMQLLDPKPQAAAPAPQPAAPQYQQTPAPRPQYAPQPQAPAPAPQPTYPQYAPQPQATAPQYEQQGAPVPPQVDPNLDLPF